jgi:hypothetical protein
MERGLGGEAPLSLPLDETTAFFVKEKRAGAINHAFVEERYSP